MGKIKKASANQIGYIRMMHYKLNEFMEAKANFSSLTNFRANKIIEKLEKRVKSGDVRKPINKEKIKKRFKSSRSKKVTAIEKPKESKTILRKRVVDNNH